MAAQAPEVTLGVRLYMARKKATLEQAELASAVGVSRSLVSMWERDLAEPKPSQLRRVADCTEVPYTWLMGADPLNICCSVEQGSLLGPDGSPAFDFEARDSGLTIAALRQAS